MLLWATEAMTLAGLLLATWLHDRRMREIGVWGAAFGCHGIGVALVGLRGHIPDLASIHVGNAVQLCGISLWCAGLLVYDGRKPNPWLLLPPLIWIGALLIPAIRDHFWARTIVAQSTSATIYAAFGLLLLQGRRKPRLVRLVFAGVTAVQSFLMYKMAFDSFENRPSTFTEMPNFVIYAIGNIFCLVSGILLGTRLLMARTEERLRHLALTDPLTGVLNRRGFIDRFHELRRDGTSERPLLALVLFDLDHFKQINDRYGHAGGDTVLMAFCRIATAHIGQAGVFGRMGGEEFACLLPVAKLEESAEIADKIRVALAMEDIHFGASTLRATVSAGIAIAGVRGGDLDEMLIAADKALYASKAAGRNQISASTKSANQQQTSDTSWDEHATCLAGARDAPATGRQAVGG